MDKAESSQMGAGLSAPVVEAEFGFVKDASGSARVRLGETEVVCSIFGPRVESGGGSVFSDIGRLQINVKYGPFAVPVDFGTAADPEDTLADLLQEALSSIICLEKYPKCTISIFVVIMQACGSELACILSSASLALIDAAIEVKDVLAPCTVAVTDAVVDMYPAHTDLATTDAVLTACYSPALESFAHVYFKGRVTPSKMSGLLEVAKRGSQQMRSIMSLNIARNAQNFGKMKLI